MITNMLLEKIKEVEKIALASKSERFLMHPFKYSKAILFRELIYKNRKQELGSIADTFFNKKMHILLPSSTDIYLTGGKSHVSEIHLAKFLILNLQNGETFVDVGAHYGYFSLLSSVIVGENGLVYAFEASPKSYNILKKNADNCSNVHCYNVAVSDEDSTLKFYEFPNLYSEYNTLDVQQFQNEEWFSNYTPRVIDIKSMVLERFFDNEKVIPKIIKIDVEGAEFKVIKGLKNFLSSHAPYVVMEFLSEKRGNVEHTSAENLLKDLGFFPFMIDHDGHLVQLEDISAYFKTKNLDSDNIVFKKLKMGD
ncbi:MAG: FkbM family methyltransferase [Lewinellaceae bacterium]|nr:FkbM family methyltransferase [Lewinellaceae bacterium]